MNKTAYIPFEEVRAHPDANLQTVLSYYGIKIPSGQSQFKTPCVFHEDRTPSLSISLTLQNFRCFGCGADGDMIEFINQMEGGTKGNKADRHQAHHKLAEIIGYSPEKGTEKPVKAKPKAEPQKQKKTPEKAVSDGEVHKENPPLDLEKIRMELTTDHPFFESHGISEAMIETFGLGYTSTGIMKGRVVIPIHNVEGEIVAFAGRYASEQVPDGQPRYRLPKNFHRGLELFNIHRAKEVSNRYLVIVEGYWSAMRLHLEGIPVVATLGTSISDEQVSLIAELGYRHAIVLFDGDDEGRSGATGVVTALSNKLYVRKFDLDEGVKPDTMTDEWITRLKP